MLEIVYNQDKSIKAVCEYLLFTKDGILDESGEVCLIGELEITEGNRGNGLVRYFMRTMLKNLPKVNKIVWFRRKKYPTRKQSIYTRQQIEQLTKE